VKLCSEHFAQSRDGAATLQQQGGNGVPPLIRIPKVELLQAAIQPHRLLVSRKGNEMEIIR